MALLTPGSRCALCGELLGDRPVFATSGVWLPPNHRLFRYCDAAMHGDCYEAWPDRAELARTHFEARAGSRRFGAPVLATDDLMVFLGRLGDALEVRIFLTATASGISVPLAEWEAWLEHGEFDGSTTQHTLQHLALAGVRDLLTAQLPTAEAVRAAADWEPVRAEEARRAAARRAEAAHRAERHGRLAGKTARTDALLEVLSVRGLPCPHCGQRRSDHRYSAAGWPHNESYFVCRSCGRSFTAEDLDPPAG